MSRGATVALIGAPNVGKSSLLNVLSGREEAIVTEIPGTTRDALQVDLVIGGLPMRLVDTAGVRATDDTVESEGVKRALAHADNADLILLVSQPEQGQFYSNDRSVEKELKNPNDRSKLIYVRNKVDQIDAEKEQPDGLNTVYVSALTGQGLDDLARAIKMALGFTPASDEVTARERHVQALRRAFESVQAAKSQLVDKDHGAVEMVAEDLRVAHEALGGIVGNVSADDLLGEIFSTFCIGK